MSVETQRPAGDIVRVEVPWTRELRGRVLTQTLLRNPVMLLLTLSFPASLVVVAGWPEVLRGPGVTYLSVPFLMPLLWGAIYVGIRRAPERTLGYTFREDGFEIRGPHGQFNGIWSAVSRVHTRPHAREFVIGGEVHVLPLAVMSDADRVALDRLFAQHVTPATAPRHQLLKLLALWAVLLVGFFAFYQVFVGSASPR